MMEIWYIQWSIDTNASINNGIGIGPEEWGFFFFTSMSTRKNVGIRSDTNTSITKKI